ncbi:MAG: radical SAM protein [Methanothrix sp.]|nr:radical SAM protein [Methanothrix sp.]
MDQFLARLSDGVFSRFYSLSDGKSASVAYHTPSQSAVFFEGDSAEVWWRIFQAKGSTTKALDYILHNGVFEGSPEKEAKATLACFIEGLKASGLLTFSPQELIANTNSILPNPPPKSTEISSENPEQSISQFMADHHILYTMLLELTYKCNERCVHCYLPEEKQLQELSLEQIDELMSEFEELGGLQIQLTGGEPLIRDDFVDILKLSYKHGFVTSITTNLTLLNQDNLDAIITAHPRSIGCSIYSARPELHDAITMTVGSFEKSIRSIRVLRAAELPVVIKSPLMESTAPYWREIEDLANELGCEYQFDVGITAKNDGILSPLAHRVVNPVVLKDIFSSRYYKLFIGDEQMSAMSGPSPDASLCGAGGCGLAVSPDGTIRPCLGLNVSLAKWPETSLLSVWDGSPFFSDFGAIRLCDISPCNDCDALAFCSRCPGAWFAEHGDYRRPSQYTCFIAHTMAEAHLHKQSDSFRE